MDSLKPNANVIEMSAFVGIFFGYVGMMIPVVLMKRKFVMPGPGQNHRNLENLFLNWGLIGMTILTHYISNIMNQ